MLGRGFIGALVAALALCAAPIALADVIVVDDDGFGRPTSCAGGGLAYSSLQHALNAASAGDVVRVCPGVYTGNVSVTKRVTIEGRTSGATTARYAQTCAAYEPARGLDAILQPALPFSPTINVVASNVTLRGLVLRGNDTAAAIATSAAGGGYVLDRLLVRDNALGLLLAGSGARSSVSSSCFRANNAAPGTPGLGNGFGIRSGALLSHARIDTNTFVANASAGVMLAAAPGNGISVVGNKSLGDGVFASLGATVGARVSGNVVRDSGAGGIELGPGNHATVISGNSLESGRGYAIRVDSGFGERSDGVQISGNFVRSFDGDGIVVAESSLSGGVLKTNVVRSNGGDGIRVEGGNDGNTLTKNTLVGNGGTDCHDDFSGSVWLANTAATQNRDGVCPGASVR